MKNRFISRMTDTAKRHERLKKPLFVVVAVYLAVYHAVFGVYSNKKRIISTVALVACLVLTTSFAYPQDSVYGMGGSGGKLYMETQDGIIEIDEMDMAKFSATEEDLKALVEETRVSENIVSKDPGTIEEGTLIYDETEGYQEATFEDDWKLILINKECPIPEGYEPELGTIRGNIKSDVRVIEHVLAMIQAAKEDGVTLAICSPYRDYDRQVMLFERKVKSYIKQGKPEEEAYELASQTVAIPGTSEHQAGLAFDFISDDYTTLDAGFADCAAGKWLKANAAEYGFILRYPLGKEDVTEIEFEPWHYRYVGQEAAADIMGQEICLEEYVEQIGLK